MIGQNRALVDPAIDGLDVKMVHHMKLILDAYQPKIAQQNQPGPQLDTLFDRSYSSSDLRVGGIYCGSPPQPQLDASSARCVSLAR